MTTSVLDRTIEIIVAKSGIDSDKITPETELSTLDIDSLGLAEIIFDLEDEFDVDIDMNAAAAWDNLKTVADVARSVSDLVARDS